MNKSKLFTFKNGLIAVIVVYIISLLTKKPTVLNKEQILTEINNAENQVNQVNQVQPSENLQLSIGQNSLQRHKAVLKWRLSYYIQDIQWNTAKGGWTTRALVVAKYFSNLITMEKIISQKSIYETNYNQKRIDLRTDFNISISI